MDSKQPQEHAPDTESTKKIKDEILKGGLWTDENLRSGLDWQGESPQKQAVEEEPIHYPKTETEQDNALLQSADLGQEVIAAVARRVEQRILKSSSTHETSLSDLVKQELSTQVSRLDEWIAAQEAAYTKRMEETSQYARKNDLDRLAEKVAALEQRVSTVISSFTATGAQEQRIIQEAYKIIKDRQATEESIAASEDNSVVQRFESRINTLGSSLRALEPLVPFADQQSLTIVKEVNSAKSKFGRRG